MSILSDVNLPAFDLPDQMPGVGGKEYTNRIIEAHSRITDLGCDVWVVYADRENFANLSFLTGYDPRFESALLVVKDPDKPVLIVGIENMEYSKLSPVRLDRILYQGFGLMGQDRSKSPRLEPLLRDSGIKTGCNVGVVGAKYVDNIECDNPSQWFDVPAFLLDDLTSVVGSRDNLSNVTQVFINPKDGLRSTNSIDQLAAFEFAASHCSQAIRNLLTFVQPGMTEIEAVQEMRLNGLPLSAHLMFSTGHRTRYGLASPEDRIIEKGDPFMAALGYRGGLTARAGYITESLEELPSESQGYLDELVRPYFDAVVAWYETVGLGVSGGTLMKAVEDVISGAAFSLFLNPGHLIHLDEWLHSPVYRDSDISLKTGTLIQMDIIPVPSGELHTCNAEDTIAVVGDAGREALREKYPAVWKRILDRRSFMSNVLGIQLKPEVLPFSNMPGCLHPFVLDRGRALVS